MVQICQGILWQGWCLFLNVLRGLVNSFGLQASININWRVLRNVIHAMSVPVETWGGAQLLSSSFWVLYAETFALFQFKRALWGERTGKRKGGPAPMDFLLILGDSLKWMPDPLALRSSGFHLQLSLEDWKDDGWDHRGWRGFHKGSLEAGKFPGDTGVKYRQPHACQKKSF